MTAAVIIVVAVRDSGTGPPPGTPYGAQLAALLPAGPGLPSGWYLVHSADSGHAYLQTGRLPPRPLDACYDFNLGFDLGIAGDTFLSSASETAQYGDGPGDGFLRIDLFSVRHGDAAAAVAAVATWARQCSSYTDAGVSYAVTAAAVPGLGRGSLDVRVTPQGATAVPVRSSRTLLAWTGDAVIAIECLVPPQTAAPSLTSLAAPMARRLPSAGTLPVTRAGPRSGPAPRPDLTAAQLNRLLPVTAGLPAEYYQGVPPSPADTTAGTQYPLEQPPAPLSCDQIPRLEGAGLTQADANYRTVAALDVYSPESDRLDVVIDETSSVALARADLSALRQAAARCPRVNASVAGLITRLRTTVTSVPGLGDQNVDVTMTPLSASANGPQGILLVQVGAALLLVDYCLAVPGTALPPVTAMARPIAGKL